MTNIAKSSDLGKGDSITTYDVLDLQEIIDSNIPIVSVQKGVVEKGLTRILEGMGIENLGKDTLENSMGRSGFMSIDSREYGEIGILGTKGADSTQSFAQISDYYLGGTDIGDKVQARGLGLEEKERVLGEIIWGCKTELLLLLGENFINNSGNNLSSQELDILTTKFTPTLTEMVLKKLPQSMKIPDIDEVDSNSELNIQIQEILNPQQNVGAIEIVQSGKSLIATDSFVVKDGKIFEPSLRRKEDDYFEGNIIGELSPKSQAGMIANGIQSSVDLALYGIVNQTKNKPVEFIEAIQESMRNL